MKKKKRKKTRRFPFSVQSSAGARGTLLAVIVIISAFPSAQTHHTLTKIGLAPRQIYDVAIATEQAI